MTAVQCNPGGGLSKSRKLMDVVAWTCGLQWLRIGVPRWVVEVMKTGGCGCRGVWPAVAAVQRAPVGRGRHRRAAHVPVRRREGSTVLGQVVQARPRVLPLRPQGVECEAGLPAAWCHC